MNCKKCAAIVQEDSFYCPTCRAPISPEAVTSKARSNLKKVGVATILLGPIQFFAMLAIAAVLIPAYGSLPHYYGAYLLFEFSIVFCLIILGIFALARLSNSFLRIPLMIVGAIAGILCLLQVILFVTVIVASFGVDLGFSLYSSIYAFMRPGDDGLFVLFLFPLLTSIASLLCAILSIRNSAAIWASKNNTDIKEPVIIYRAPGIMNCRRCGIPIQEGDVFCSVCGAAVSRKTVNLKAQRNLRIASIFAIILGPLQYFAMQATFVILYPPLGPMPPAYEANLSSWYTMIVCLIVLGVFALIGSFRDFLRIPVMYAGVIAGIMCLLLVIRVAVVSVASFGIDLGFSIYTTIDAIYSANALFALTVFLSPILTSVASLLCVIFIFRYSSAIKWSYLDFLDPPSASVES